MAATCPRCGAPLGRSPAEVAPPASPDAASTRLKVHTIIATALILGSSVGLMAETRTTAAGPSIAAVVFGLLFVLAILYYVEVRVRSSHHRR